MKISEEQLEELISNGHICVNKKLKIRDYMLICGKKKIKASCTQWWSTFGSYKSALYIITVTS